MVFPSGRQMDPLDGGVHQFVIRLDVTKPIPLYDLGDFLEDLSAIFKIGAEEYFMVTKQDPSLVPELYVTKLSGGSIELVTDFFANGVVQSVIGSIIFVIGHRLLFGNQPRLIPGPTSQDEEVATQRASPRAGRRIRKVTEIMVKFGVILVFSYKSKSEDLEGR